MKSMRDRDLTKGSIFKTIFILAAPIILAMSLQTAFNIIDTFFVGMLGSEQLAAISVTFPVVFIFIAIASGLAIGSTALVSQAIGGRNLKEANKTAAHSITVGLLSGLVVAFAGFLFSPLLFSFMGVSGEILAMTIEYANLIFIGFIFLFIGFIAQGLIQADGDTITPMINMIISIIVNIILDPILIFGLGPIPAMSLTGAAIATVLGRSVGAFLNIYHLCSGKTKLHMGMESFKLDIGIFKKIFIIGLPSSISNSINSIGMILIMSLIGTFGTSAIAAFGVGMRFDSVAILPIIGLSSAVIPFIGQNLGAGKIERAQKAMKYSSYASIILMSLLSLVWFFLPEYLIMPFSSDPEVLKIGEMYLRIMSLGFIFMGINLILGASMQASGKTGLQLMVNAGRWVFIIFIALLLLDTLQLEGIALGIPLGNFAGTVLALIFIKSGLWLRGWNTKK